MQKVINIYKPIGITPLQLIKQLQQKNPIYQYIKIGYAGRLDPMAHGVMLLTLGEENKNREKYLTLPKTYQFTCLFGLETDSYDLLGILKSPYLNNTPKDLKPKINKFLKQFTGKMIQQYPPYSSKTVQGIPLFKWARENKLDQINIPTREIEIYNFQLLNYNSITLKELKLIIKQIDTIEGFFRQDLINTHWNEFFNLHDFSLQLTTANFEIECSTGTYIRQLVHLLGQELGCGSLTLDIKRTKLGDFNIDQSLTL